MNPENFQNQQPQPSTSRAQEFPPAEPFLHPLRYRWTLWFYEANFRKPWRENLNVVATFETVEDFWCLYFGIKRPSELQIGCDYALFKEGIWPMWEDSANQNGGRWVLNFSRCQASYLDSCWVSAMMCQIGENFANSDEICGAVVNVRAKGSKISLWTKNSNNIDAISEIGATIRRELKLTNSYRIQYQTHTDAMLRNKTYIMTL